MLVSHDIWLIENVCDELLIIEDRKIKSFQGNYQDYRKSKETSQIDSSAKNIKDIIMLLENQISHLLGKISSEQNEAKRAEYDKEYNLKLAELARLSQQTDDL